MSTIVFNILSKLPYVKMLRWLLAESNWGKDVAVYLAAENAWYFKMAAELWSNLAGGAQLSLDDLKAAVLAALGK